MRLKESNHVRDANEEGLSIAIVSYIYTVLFRRILVIGCILVCIFCMSYSQQGMDSIFLNLETLKIKDGLSQGMVRSIIQDKEGYMWFATKDGLNRYDGYRISVYRNDLKIKYSLPDNYVTNLAEDEYGHFWVGTSTKGLLLFDKIKERFYPIDIIPQFQTLANKEIRFLECKGKNLILATTRNIYIFDISQFKSSEHSNLKQNIRLVFDYNKSGPKFPYQDPSDLSQSISWMPNKDLWVCRKDGIAICKPRSDLNQWELKEHPITDFGINKNNFTSIYPCKIHGQPKYFLQLREHILIYNDSSKLLEQDVKTAFNKSYTLPRADSNGNILFTISSDHYLFQSKYNKFLKIIPNKEKIHLSNLGFCIDQQGILWLGTNGFGVTKYDPKKQFFQATNTWQKRLSNSISSDPLLTKSGRPVKWNRAKNTYDDFLSGLFLKHKFTHIIEDSAGIVWMKSNFVDSLRSLISLDQKTKKIKEYFALNLYPKQFESFYLDRSNQIWMIFYNSTKMQSAIRLFDPIKDSFTKEYVIERNIMTEPGTVYNENQVKQDLVRLYSTQAFKDVNRTIEVSEDNPDRFDVTIELKEQRTASVSVGGGLDSATGAFGSVGISDNNFRGLNQRVSLTGLVGSGILMSDSSIMSHMNYQAELSFFEPHFLNADNSLMSKIYYRDLGSYQIPLALERRIGIEGTVAHKLKYNKNLSTTLTTGVEYIHLSEGDANNIANLYKAHGLDIADRAKQLEGGLFLRLAPGLAYDSRDSAVNPRHGALASVRFEEAFGLDGFGKTNGC